MKLWAWTFAFFVASVMSLMTSCAPIIPVPGGSSAVNANCVSSAVELEWRLAGVSKGTAEEKVFQTLCDNKGTFQRLDKRDIRLALLGGENISFARNPPAFTDEILESLYAYKINFKSINRKHGFTSPVRVATEESGYDYTVIIIFKNGSLYQDPIITGGVVKSSTSGTIFDFLSPGMVGQALR